ncbi:putative metal-binding motif-containing protein [Candidatus Parcubacteria bacterium]|nr:putative metal-binding motif-containing protein [Candidatus Parcubacteria bacterium]
MLKSKQLFINVVLVVLAICVGAGTIMAVKADGFEYDTCNGQYIDFYIDEDGDGFGDSSATSTAACSAPLNYASNNLDCDDSSATTSPEATEICGDGIDNDCVGGDEACVWTYYLDADGDGYGKSAYSISSTTEPTGYVEDNTDCDDSNASINPGEDEICGDGIDNDCVGGDEACVWTYYLDADGDGYGNPAYSISSTTEPTGYVEDNTDCDDSSATTSPGATEICGDGIDNDCSGGDETCASVEITYYSDEDEDGYGNPTDSISSTTQPTGYVLDNTDCDDADSSINPDADEVCLDGIDNNCDGNIDTDCIDNGDGDDDIFIGCDPFGNSFSNHGGFVSCLAHYTNWLKSHGEITGREKGQIMSANANKYKNNNGNNGKSNSNNGKAKGKKK